MRHDIYKKLMFKKWLMPRVIGASISLIVILVVVIIVSMNDRTIRLHEGITKSMPLLSNEKMKMLGDLYVKLNLSFEKEIKDLELNYANRYNKRGDKIHYGVNGKENVDMMINDDYVNGIESISYIKGNATNRKDGESNFTDMMAFLSASLGSDIDRYSEDQLESIFTKLFHMTHTFTGTSTELYPCDHGCAWCKYYCGDSRCQGVLNGNTVGFYESDLYMGEEGKYGLMYDPFLIKKQSNYTMLRELARNERELKTTYQYKIIKSRYVETGDGGYTLNEIKTTGDTVVTEDDEIYELMEPEGYCPVCSGRRETFTETTRKIGGCINHVRCHHGWVETISEGEDDPGHDVFWYMGRNREDCDQANPEFKCNHEHSDSCEWEDDEKEEAEAEGVEINGCKHETYGCKPESIGCAGYYTCNGHDHYACPGHIMVCCFGHTNLNLEIKIIYYEEMIDDLKSIINE